MKIAITGAASGIGAEVVLRLRAGGHSVTAFDIVDPGAQVDRWVRTDMADPASIDAALSEAGEDYDGLINNAGVPPRQDNAAQVLSINFIGLRRFQEGMLSRLLPGASIVSTASRAGSQWRENIEQVRALMALDEVAQLAGFIAAHAIDPVRAYNLSKEAVIVMSATQTGTLLGRGVRCNSVSPAAVNTDILADFKAAFGDRVAANLKRVGRAGTPGEIADVIVWLCSPQSHWIKGQDIVIDGGMSALALADTLDLSAR